MSIASIAFGRGVDRVAFIVEPEHRHVEIRMGAGAVESQRTIDFDQGNRLVAFLVEHLPDTEHLPPLERDGDFVVVTGPALVRSPGSGEYEVATGLTLKFPADSEVWLKVSD